MLKLFSAFRKNKIWDFNGGIHPPEMKTQSNGTPLRQVPLPAAYPWSRQNAAGSRAHLGYRYGYCAPLYGSSFSFS